MESESTALQLTAYRGTGHHVVLLSVHCRNVCALPQNMNVAHLSLRGSPLAVVLWEFFFLILMYPPLRAPVRHCQPTRPEPNTNCCLLNNNTRMVVLAVKVGTVLAVSPVLKSTSNAPARPSKHNRARN